MKGKRGGLHQLNYITELHYLHLAVYKMCIEPHLFTIRLIKATCALFSINLAHDYLLHPPRLISKVSPFGIRSQCALYIADVYVY